MLGDLTVTKAFAIALGATLMPCLALAVNMPSGISPEEVDTTALGTGQDAEPAPAAAGWSVQLGAYGDKDAAQARLDHIAGMSPDEFSHAASAVVPFAWGGGRTLYRARFTGFSEEDAKALCARLDRLGESCFAVASETDDAGGKNVIEAKAAARPLLDSSRLVSNEDLSTMRGGFFTAGGAQFDFGASIRTLVNGQLALQTNLSWTPAGSVVQQLAGLGTSIRAQVAADLAKAGITAPVATSPIAASLQTSNTVQTGNSGPAGNLAPAAPIDPPSTTSGAASFVANAAPTVLSHVPVLPAINPPANNDVPPNAGNAPAGTNGPAPMVLTGVQIQSPAGGTTQVFANVTASQIQNIILNSASNQTITQDTNLTLTIYNFSAWQQQLAQHALSAQLANEILAASGFRH